MELDGEANAVFMYKFIRKSRMEVTVCVCVNQGIFLKKKVMKLRYEEAARLLSKSGVCIYHWSFTRDIFYVICIVNIKFHWLN